jgi:hypothetical protein
MAEIAPEADLLEFSDDDGAANAEFRQHTELFSLTESRLDFYTSDQYGPSPQQLKTWHAEGDSKSPEAYSSGDIFKFTTSAPGQLTKVLLEVVSQILLINRALLPFRNSVFHGAKF